MRRGWGVGQDRDELGVDGDFTGGRPDESVRGSVCGDDMAGTDGDSGNGTRGRHRTPQVHLAMASAGRFRLKMSQALNATVGRYASPVCDE